MLGTWTNFSQGMHNKTKQPLPPPPKIKAETGVGYNYITSQGFNNTNDQL